jgi:hypothetical protein
VGVKVGVWEGVKVAVGGSSVNVGDGVIGVGELVIVGSTISVGAMVSRGGGSVSAGAVLQAAKINRNKIEIKSLADVRFGINIEISPPGVSNSRIINQVL